MLGFLLVRYGSRLQTDNPSRVTANLRVLDGHSGYLKADNVDTGTKLLPPVLNLDVDTIGFG